MPNYGTDLFLKNYICSLVWRYALQVFSKRFTWKIEQWSDIKLFESPTVGSFKISMQFFFDVIRRFALRPKESKCLNQSFSLLYLYSLNSHTLTFSKKHFSGNHESTCSTLHWQNNNPLCYYSLPPPPTLWHNWWLFLHEHKIVHLKNSKGLVLAQSFVMFPWQ